MAIAARVEGVQWLKGPLAGIGTSSILAGIARLPWAAIFSGALAAIPAVIGIYYGLLERRLLYEYRREKQRIDLEAYRKKAEQSVVIDAHPAQPEPEPKPLP